MLSLRKARIFSTIRISLRCKRFFNRGACPKSASSVNSTLPGALQETDYTLKFRLFGQAWGGGIRDAKYFLFRLKNIYAQTQGFTLEPGFSVIIKQRDRPGGDGLIIELSSNPFYSANVTLIALNRHCAVAVKVISFAFPVHTKPSKLPTSEVIGPSFPP